MKNKLFILVVMLILAVGITSCIQIQAPLPLPTLTPLPTQVPYPPLPTLTPFPTQTQYPKVTLCTGPGVSAYRTGVKPILALFTTLTNQNRVRPLSGSPLGYTDTLNQAKHMLKATQALNPPPLLTIFHLFLVNREEAFIDWISQRDYPAMYWVTPPVITVTVPDFTGDVMIEWGLINNYCNWQ